MSLDDQASYQEELWREKALTLRRPEGPLFTGHCHNCEEPVPSNARFCDANCREDYELRKRMKKERIR